MTDEKLKELANLECAKLLKSEKGYNGLSYQEFWAEGMKYGLTKGRKEAYELYDTEVNDMSKDYEERLKKLESKLNDSNELCNKQAMRIAELEAQIEKMKNFYNCAHSSRVLCPNEHKCNGCKDWEITE